METVQGVNFGPYRLAGPHGPVLRRSQCPPAQSPGGVVDIGAAGGRGSEQRGAVGRGLAGDDCQGRGDHEVCARLRRALHDVAD